MKMSLKVVCGILIWNDKVLIGKRKLTNEHQPGKWEFPGGKMEEGETIDETIIREFKEELDIDISYGDYIGYPEKEDKMRYYVVSNDGRVTSDIKHTIGGYKAFYRTITCSWVSENEFKGI